MAFLTRASPFCQSRSPPRPCCGRYARSSTKPSQLLAAQHEGDCNQPGFRCQVHHLTIQEVPLRLVGWFVCLLVSNPCAESKVLRFDSPHRAYVDVHSKVSAETRPAVKGGRAISPSFSGVGSASLTRTPKQTLPRLGRRTTSLYACHLRPVNGYVLPTIPMEGEAVREAMELVRQVFTGYGFIPHVTLNSASE